MHLNRGDVVAVRRQHTPHVVDAGVVGAARSPDEHPVADEEHVASVSGGRRFHLMQWSIFPQRAGDRGCLGTPRCRARTSDDRHLVEDDRCVFDEDGVRHVRSRVEPLDVTSGFPQTRLVRGMLLAGPVEVDGRTIEMRQLAARDRRTELSGKSDKPLTHLDIR